MILADLLGVALARISHRPLDAAFGHSGSAAKQCRDEAWHFSAVRV